MMIDHLDHNGAWVLLVFAITLGALALSGLYTLARTRARKKKLGEQEDS